MTSAVPDPSDNFNLYLPDWATGTTTSWCVGAQLRTKDGRRLGNAVIASYHLGELSPWEVVTDAGTTLRLDEAELDELFWPPSWVMDAATSPGIRARAALAQPEPEGPTDEELYQFWESHPELGLTCDEPVKLLRAGLTRFARPAIRPVPATEPVPVEDCDGDGNCWWFCPAAILPNGQCAYWCLAPADGARSWFTHWLPARAMPIPSTH
jgi:hypothetical protein